MLIACAHRCAHRCAYGSAVSENEEGRRLSIGLQKTRRRIRDTGLLCTASRRAYKNILPTAIPIANSTAPITSTAGIDIPAACAT